MLRTRVREPRMPAGGDASDHGWANSRQLRKSALDATALTSELTPRTVRVTLGKCISQTLESRKSYLPRSSWSAP
jgi:hypothetical protein